MCANCMDSPALRVERTVDALCGMNDKMEQASRLLHTIKQKERTDNMIFYGGLCFFFLVVTFIVTKRTGKRVDACSISMHV